MIEEQLLSGISVRFRKLAQPRARVVFCHGLGEHGGRYLAVADRFALRGIESIMFDFRGCGLSDGERQWIETFTDYLDDLRRVLTWESGLTHAPLFLFGHSLGGAIAVHYLAREKDARVRGLILSAPAFSVGKGVSALKIWVGRKLTKVTPHLKVSAALDLSALSRVKEVETDYRNDRLNCLFNTIRQGAEILTALEVMPLMASQLRLPALIGHGTEDRLIDIKGSFQLRELIPGSSATFIPFEGGFHELHNDLCRDEWIQTMVKWIEERSA